MFISIWDVNISKYVRCLDVRCLDVYMKQNPVIFQYRFICAQDIRDMFNTADKDRDGRISYQEFLVSPKSRRINLEKPADVHSLRR